MHRQFWEEHPALLYALSVLIGSSCYLFWEIPWSLLFFASWIGYLLFLRRTLLFLLVIASWGYSWFIYSNAPELSEPEERVARFAISSLQPHSSPFERGLAYKGTLYLSECALPCTLFYRGSAPPPASCDYFLRGKLQQRGPYQYTFKPKEWHPIEGTWSLAELRYQTKERLRKFLKKHLPSSAFFLSSLITGDVEDRLLRYEFGRLGIQHILAVSGFHFGVLIACSSFFLSFFLPRFGKLLLLALTITAYFFFVGSSPAVQRSWLTAELYLFSKMLNRQTSGLNLLGASMLFESIGDPLISANIGFQLSFLSCLGLLLFCPLFEKLLHHLLPKRSPIERETLHFFSQHGYLLSSFLRRSLALTLAINLALLPVLLYHFHTFSLLGLFYNLFVPFWVGLCLFSLTCALLVYFLFPPLALLLFWSTDLFTSKLLQLISYPPLLLDYSLRYNGVPAWSIPLYLFALLSLVLYLKKKCTSLTDRAFMH